MWINTPTFIRKGVEINSLFLHKYVHSVASAAGGGQACLGRWQSHIYAWWRLRVTEGAVQMENGPPSAPQPTLMMIRLAVDAM